MGLCGPQWTPQKRREHFYDSGHTWSFPPGAAGTPVPGLHGLKVMNNEY